MINTHNKNTSCWALANSDCNFWKLNQANAFWQFCRHLRDLLPFKSGALHRLHLHPVQQQLLRQHRHHLREAVQDDAGSDNGRVWFVQSQNFGDIWWGLVLRGWYDKDVFLLHTQGFQNHAVFVPSYISKPIRRNFISIRLGSILGCLHSERSPCTP